MNIDTNTSGYSNRLFDAPLAAFDNRVLIKQLQDISGYDINQGEIVYSKADDTYYFGLALEEVAAFGADPRCCPIPLRDASAYTWADDDPFFFYDASGDLYFVDENGDNQLVAPHPLTYDPVTGILSYDDGAGNVTVIATIPTTFTYDQPTGQVTYNDPVTGDSVPLVSSEHPFEFINGCLWYNDGIEDPIQLQVDDYRHTGLRNNEIPATCPPNFWGSLRNTTHLAVNAAAAQRSHYRAGHIYYDSTGMIGTDKLYPIGSATPILDEQKAWPGITRPYTILGANMNKNDMFGRGYTTTVSGTGLIIESQIGGGGFPSQRFTSLKTVLPARLSSNAIIELFFTPLALDNNSYWWISLSPRDAGQLNYNGGDSIFINSLVTLRMLGQTIDRIYFSGHNTSSFYSLNNWPTAGGVPLVNGDQYVISFQLSSNGLNVLKYGHPRAGWVIGQTQQQAGQGITDPARPYGDFRSGFEDRMTSTAKGNLASLMFTSQTETSGQQIRIDAITVLPEDVSRLHQD